MENLPNKLTTYEQGFLEKYHFIVIKVLELKPILIRAFIAYCILVLSIGLILVLFSNLLRSLDIPLHFLNHSVNYIIGILLGIYIIGINCIILHYFKGRYLFLSTEGVFAFNKMYIKNDNSYLTKYNKFLTKSTTPSEGTVSILFSMLLLGFLSIILPIIIASFIVSIPALILSRLFQPFYIFGNLGLKIQSLTPRIEEQSKQIQSEFQSDMNFSVLSKGFDSLSTTFSSIVTLVIKLENVEARANKGNLFDSEKYINSLRSDIVTPLTSLKRFLEKQKSELIQSEKELTRVRVGESESMGNIELQSKRSESLISELTENIEKLDVMIGKMG